MERTANTGAARTAIFSSIRSHLASSTKLDAREEELKHKSEATELFSRPSQPMSTAALVELFEENLRAVNGHCLTVNNESELLAALENIVTELRPKLPALRIATSDSPVVRRLVKMIGVNVDEIATTPPAGDVFRFDIGISEAQSGIAETGTLLLDSSHERHRLVSLVPPVHIAILDASKIVATLGEALATLRRDKEVSPLVTLITGPSRTADIELTLAIGVHGPQELYVLIRG